MMQLQKGILYISVILISYGCVQKKLKILSLDAEPMDVFESHYKAVDYPNKEIPTAIRMGPECIPSISETKLPKTYEFIKQVMTRIYDSLKGLPNVDSYLKGSPPISILLDAPKVPNAFAMGARYAAHYYTGLWLTDAGKNLASVNDAQFAFVAAHELMHHTRAHGSGTNIAQYQNIISESVPENATNTAKEEFEENKKLATNKLLFKDFQSLTRLRAWTNKENAKGPIPYTSALAFEMLGQLTIKTYLLSEAAKKPKSKTENGLMVSSANKESPGCIEPSFGTSKEFILENIKWDFTNNETCPFNDSIFQKTITDAVNENLSANSAWAQALKKKSDKKTLLALQSNYLSKTKSSMLKFGNLLSKCTLTEQQKSTIKDFVKKTVVGPALQKTLDEKLTSAKTYKDLVDGIETFADETLKKLYTGSELKDAVSDEEEADFLAVLLTKRAGFDPLQFGSLLGCKADSSKGVGSNSEIYPEKTELITKAFSILGKTIKLLIINFDIDPHEKSCSRAESIVKNAVTFETKYEEFFKTTVEMTPTLKKTNGLFLNDQSNMENIIREISNLKPLALTEDDSEIISYDLRELEKP